MYLLLLLLLLFLKGRLMLIFQDLKTEVLEMKRNFFSLSIKLPTDVKHETARNSLYCAFYYLRTAIIDYN